MSSGSSMSSMPASAQMKEINRTHNYSGSTHTHIESGVIRLRGPHAPPRHGNPAHSHGNPAHSHGNPIHSNVHHPPVAHHGHSTVHPMSAIQSMAVNVDNRDNYTREDVEMTDMTMAREDPQPLPQAIYRNENHYRALNRVPPLLNPNEMNVDREEVVTSMTYMEPSRHHHAPLVRQGSDESNARQPINESRFQNKKLDLNITAPRGATQMTNGHDFVSPSPQTPTTSPLDKLQQITGSERFMPDENYKNMIEQKNREELLYNRLLHDDLHKKKPSRGGATMVGNCKENAASNDWFNFKNPGACGNPSQSPEVSGKISPGNKEQAVKTFPLRAKSMLTCGANESPQDRPSVLTKSQSMPSDMKPAEYRKGGCGK